MHIPVWSCYDLSPLNYQSQPNMFFFFQSQGWDKVAQSHCSQVRCARSLYKWDLKQREVILTQSVTDGGGVRGGGRGFQFTSLPRTRVPNLESNLLGRYNSDIIEGRGQKVLSTEVNLNAPPREPNTSFRILRLFATFFCSLQAPPLYKPRPPVFPPAHRSTNTSALILGIFSSSLFRMTTPASCFKSSFWQTTNKLKIQTFIEHNVWLSFWGRFWKNNNKKKEIYTWYWKKKKEKQKRSNCICFSVFSSLFLKKKVYSS